MGFSSSNGNEPDNITITLTAGGKLQTIGGVPVGGIVAWVKDFTNTPALPSNYVECNGQVLSNGSSVYNGQTIPNINVAGRFLAGFTVSGATGGSATNTHTHTATTSTGSTTGDTFGGGTDGSRATHTHTLTTSAPSDTSILPPYYTVVYVMRIY